MKVISEDASALGMSVLELLIALTMLTIFTGVVAAVMEVTVVFMRDAECPRDVRGNLRCNDNSDDGEVAQGALIDRVRIESLFDQMEEVLIQPGVTLSQLNQISSPLMARPSLQECIAPPPPNDPGNYSWRSLGNIPELPELVGFPPGYQLCLWSTSLVESSMGCLLQRPAPGVTCNPRITPGIYVLQALPYRLNGPTLPVRRLICRPRPFC